MSRFTKLSHVIWHCQYHIIWVPKYRYRVLKGGVAAEVFNCIQVFSGQLGCEVVEANVQPDHVHLLVNIPPILLSEGLVDCVFVQYVQNYYGDGNYVTPLWKFSVAS